MPVFNSTMFILGVFGGALPEITRIIRSRRSGKFPNYYKTLKFWLGVLFLLALGGLAAWLLAAKDLQSAIAFGYAAPELFTRLSANSDGADRSAQDEFHLRSWWSL